MGETALVRGSDVVGSPEVVGGSAGISNSGLGTRRRGTSQVVPDSVAAREMRAPVARPARERFVSGQRGHLRVVADPSDRPARLAAPAVYTDPWPDKLPGSRGDRRGSAESLFVAIESRPVQKRAAARADHQPADHATTDHSTVHAPAVRPTSRRAPVRLTRRGRLVVLLLVLALSASLVALLASTSNAAAPAPPHTVVVHPGDTLWSIASRIHPRGPLTATMLEIERLNHMADGTVYVGQLLIVPAS